MAHGGIRVEERMKWDVLADERVEDEAEHEVIFVVDEDSGGRTHAIIADISAEEAWISAPTADARTLSQWC